MVKKWNDLKARMLPERQIRIEAHIQAVRIEINLTELRKTPDLNQSALAEVPEKEQTSISKTE